jgi:hypothetical protein
MQEEFDFGDGTVVTKEEVDNLSPGLRKTLIGAVRAAIDADARATVLRLCISQMGRALEICGEKFPQIKEDEEVLGAMLRANDILDLVEPTNEEDS